MALFLKLKIRFRLDPLGKQKETDLRLIVAENIFYVGYVELCFL